MYPRISVLSLNAGMLQIPGTFGLVEPNPFVLQRLAMLPSIIRSVGADVVCLQEVFHAPHRSFMNQKLSGAYPFLATNDIGRRWFGVGTGLMIFSRFPLVGTFFEPYVNNSLADRLTIVRGILGSGVRLPCARTVWILNTHLIADGLWSVAESSKIMAVRRKQIHALHTVWQRMAGARRTPTLLAGDFNCGPQASACNYESLLGTFLSDAYERGGSDEHAVTWDPRQPLNVRGMQRYGPPQRIDHLLTDGTTLLPEFARIVCTECSVQISPHLAVPPSDHYGVFSTFFVT